MHPGSGAKRIILCLAVTIAAGTRAVTGAVLTVDQRTLQTDPQKPGVTTRTVVLATDDGAIESFDLDGVRSIRLVDENARRNVAEYADASAAARRSRLHLFKLPRASAPRRVAAVIS